MAEPTVQKMFGLPPDLVRDLENASEHYELTQKEIVCEAIRYFLDEELPKRRAS